MMNRIRGKVLPMMLLTLCAGLAFCAEGHAEASVSGFRAVIASDLH